MPKLTDHQSQGVTKCLLIGDSGTGKTGSLISLVEAGYNLRILDFDNGLDYLVALMRQQCPDKMESVVYHTLTDKFETKAGKALCKSPPTAFTNGMKLIHNWKTETEDLGNLGSWGPEDVLVVDSLSFMSEAAMRGVLCLVGRLNSQPEIQDWWAAMKAVESVLGVLYSSDVKCNVVVTAHIGYISGPSGKVFKGYPLTLGQKLPPKVPRYFNGVLMLERKGFGSAEKRNIITTSKGLMELKASGPEVPAELPIATGLADYFKYAQVAKGGTNARSRPK